MTPQAAVAIDQRLWTAFSGYSPTLDFVDAWLALQCQMIPGARQGWLFVESPDSSFNLITQFPTDPSDDPPDALSDALASTVEACITQAKGVAEPIGARVFGDADGTKAAHPEDEDWLVALPLIAENVIVAVTVVGVATHDPARLGSAMRHLQWGGGWVLDWLRRQSQDGDHPTDGDVETQLVNGAHLPTGDAPALSAPEPLDNASAAPAGQKAHREDVSHFDVGGLDQAPDVVRVLAAILEAKRSKDAAVVMATRFAGAFGLERVSVGVRQGARTKVLAMSHAAYAKHRMDELRRVEAAMDEALDQDAVVIIPEPDGAPSLVTRANQAVIEAGALKSAASLPVAGPKNTRGALTIEATRQLRGDEIAKIGAAARLGGLILLEKYINDRPLPVKLTAAARNGATSLVGPTRPLLKVFGGLALAGLLAIAVIPATMEVRAPVVLEAAERRVVAVPYDGYLRAAFVRAGDQVTQDQALAQFDTSDLLLERTSLTAERNQERLRFEAAKAAYKQADAKVHEARAEKISAELALVESRIARSEIKAPFDGLVISGDLSQSIGEPMKTGRELFEIAPAGAYRLVVNVDERDVALVKAGQPGRFVLAARPEDSHAFEIERVTPVLKAEGGRNFYRVEGKLAAVSDVFRPGLEGRGRIEVGSASILYLWTRDLIAWARLQIWAFLP